MLGTLGDKLKRLSDRWPDREALLSETERVTYSIWNSRANQVANYCLGRGLIKGDNVGLLLYNCLEFATITYGLYKIGAIVNLWNFRLSPAELRYVIGLTSARALFFNSEFSETVGRVMGEYPDALYVGVGPGGLPPGAVRFDEEVKSCSHGEPDAMEVTESDCASVIYTSGTMGRPKGAAYTHETQIMSGIQYDLEMGLSRGSRGLSVAPLLHGGALNFMTALMNVGGLNIFMGRYDAARAMRLIAEHRATEIMAVPSQMEDMLSVPDLKSYDFSFLKLIRTAGSPLTESLVNRVRESLGCEILNTYGMTENCSNSACYSTALDPPEKRESIGKSTYFWEARVIKAEKDRQVEPWEVVEPPGRGQLIVRGPQQVKEYYMNPEEPIVIRDGWFYTRDIVEVDADGYMFIVDRIDNIIISGGLNIYPQEVEVFLMKHPKVKEAAVVGVPHQRLGEIVMALIVPLTPDLTAEEIDDYCRGSEELASFKRPRGIKFVGELPRNVFGKIEREKLKAQYGKGAGG